MTQPNLKSNPSSSLLKDTRLAKGLTLEIVHESTKIPMDALRAIEEGYSTRMLTPFYYRGFIKIYSEFLGLKVADVLKEYNVNPPEIKQTISVAKPVQAKKTQPKKAPSSPKSQDSNVFIEELRQSWNRFWTPQNKMLAVRILAAVIALFIVVKVVGCVTTAIKNRPKAKPKVVAMVKKQPVIKKEAVKELPKVIVQEEKEEEPEEKSSAIVENKNHKVTLMVRANRNSWIQVKTDGKVAFQMTMKKGTLENWEADGQIELSGRNLGDLELEVNGKPVGSLGSFNRRAKKVLITKDGLSVKK